MIPDAPFDEDVQKRFDAFEQFVSKFQGGASDHPLIISHEKKLQVPDASHVPTKS